MDSDIAASVEALLEALVEIDRTLADDLLRAVGQYTDHEMDDVARDGAAGRNVSDRMSRISRLELLRETLERELGVEPREVLHLVVTFRREGGPFVRVAATDEELVAVADQLEARGRRALAERLRSVAQDGPTVTVFVSDYDAPMLVAATAAARRSTGLSNDWARLRDL